MGHSEVASHEAVGLPFEHWSSEEIQQRLAFDMQRYGPQAMVESHEGVLEIGDSDSEHVRTLILQEVKGCSEDLR